MGCYSGSDLPVIEVVQLWAGHPPARAAEGFLFWKPWRGEAGIGDDVQCLMHGRYAETEPCLGGRLDPVALWLIPEPLRQKR